jgi:hypothetical protein
VLRLAAPTVLIACAATFVAASPAAALDLPAGADAAPQLPPGVVVAEHPALQVDAGQGAGDLAAAAARSKPKSPNAGTRQRPFWATVNICDTAKSPNALGVRTSVPGNGTHQRIFARYTAQWWSGEEQKWLTVAGSGVTDWAPLGTADMMSRQAGWTFRFVQPPEGTTYVMRGIVELQWRGRSSRKGRRFDMARRPGTLRRSHKPATKKRKKARRAQHAAVVRERTLMTKTGMKGVEGGDPAGLSKAMCLIW